MRQLRRWHLYLGMFFAPAILLFSISGGLQTFRLHEEKGWGGKPPYWIVWMASLHRDDQLPQAKPAKPAAAPGHDESVAKKPPAPRGNPMGRRLLQIFAALLSIGLTISSILGIVIALNTRGTRGISLLMLITGTALPLLVLYL